MRTSNLLLASFAAAVFLLLSTTVEAFQPVSTRTVATVPRSTTATTTLNVFNKKKPKEDLSYIETRDMTPEEMRALNKQNEEIMNAELAGMTIFSLVLSIPMLYLVWVGFFSETAGVVEDGLDALPY